MENNITKHKKDGIQIFKDVKIKFFLNNNYNKERASEREREREH